jgi:hypothetical protein
LVTLNHLADLRPAHVVEHFGHLFRRGSSLASKLLSHAPSSFGCLKGAAFRNVWGDLRDAALDALKRRTLQTLRTYADLKAAFQPIHDQIDHNYLNEIPGLENPTSERLAVWLWNELKPRLPLLIELVIAETCTSRCVYRGQ